MVYMMLDCFEYLARSACPAPLLYAGLVFYRWARGGEISVSGSMVWEYLFLLWLVAALRVMGISSLNAGWPFAVYSPVRFGIGLDGGLTRTLLEGVMFAPCGFLAPLSIKAVRWETPSVMALGAYLAFVMALLSSISGGYVEMSFVAMGALGAGADYLAYDLMRSAAGGFSARRSPNMH